jgi:hypothetical protein
MAATERSVSGQPLPARPEALAAGMDIDEGRLGRPVRQPPSPIHRTEAEGK